MLNFGDIIDAVADTVALDAPAFIHGGRTILWPDAKRRMDSLAEELRGLGTKPGDKVAFYMRNGIEYGEMAGACFLGRFIHVNINYRYTADEVLYIIDNSDAAVLVYGAAFRDTVEAIRRRLTKVIVFVEVGDAARRPAFANAYEALTQRDPINRRQVARSPDDLVIAYTGGTTGLPKGVMYRQGDLAPYLLAASGLFGTTAPQTIADVVAMIGERCGAGARYLPACPQMHASGFFVTMWTMLTGGCVITTDNIAFDADAVWAAAAQAKATNMAIVGDAFARPLLQALDATPGKHDLRHLIGIASSGAMWSAENKHGLLAHLPQVTLADIFASSETMGMGAAITTKGATAKTASFASGPNAIVIDDDDRPLAPGCGVAGRLAVSGMQPIGYYKDPVKTAQTFKAIAGVRYSVPGDFALIEADGTLTLLGRGSHCINTAGEKVYPEEVEEALKSHASVEDALVIGVNDATWGQAVTAVVKIAAASTLDEAALREHVRARLAGYKTPKRIFATVINLRAPNGKADYKAATEAIRAHLATER